MLDISDLLQLRVQSAVETNFSSLLVNCYHGGMVNNIFLLIGSQFIMNMRYVMDIVHEIPTGTQPSPTACMPSALGQRSSLPSRVLARGRFSGRLF